MYFNLVKSTENETSVSYWVESSLYKRPINIGYTIRIKGYCTFNKITKKIMFEPIKSDSYFFQKRPWFHMLNQLSKLDKSGLPFPQQFSFAIGG